MADLEIPNAITNGIAADGAELGQNFDAIEAYINGDVIRKDGAVAMTAALTLSGAPTADLHAATKLYVDTKPRGIMGRGTAGGTNQTGITSTQTDITGCSATFTAVAGRLYKITLDANVQQVSSGGVASVTIAHGTSTRLMGRDWTLLAGVNAAFCVVWTGELTAGSITVKGRAETSAGTLTVLNAFDRSARIVVEDIGAA